MTAPAPEGPRRGLAWNSRKRTAHILGNPAYFGVVAFCGVAADPARPLADCWRPADPSIPTCTRCVKAYRRHIERRPR